jgi:hypothetical protein
MTADKYWQYSCPCKHEFNSLLFIMFYYNNGVDMVVNNQHGCRQPMDLSEKNRLMSI